MSYGRTWRPRRGALWQGRARTSITLGDGYQRRHGAASEEALEVQLAHLMHARRPGFVRCRDREIGVRLCAPLRRRRAAQKEAGEIQPRERADHVQLPLLIGIET